MSEHIRRTAVVSLRPNLDGDENAPEILVVPLTLEVPVDPRTGWTVGDIVQVDILLKRRI